MEIIGETSNGKEAICRKEENRVRTGTHCGLRDISNMRVLVLHV